MKNIAAYLTGKMQYEVREAPMPKLTEKNDVLIRIEYVGICGADLDMWLTGRYGIFNVKYPQIIGHEAAGVIEEVGSEVEDLRPGDRVALEPGIPCGTCDACVRGEYNLCPDVQFKGAPPVEGCNQKYVTHPARWCHVLPDNISTRDGALLEPLAVGMHSANQGGVQMADSAVICGGGTIGLSVLNACKAKGATNLIVVEKSPKRVAAARKLGAQVVDFSTEDTVNRVLELTNGKGADVVLDASGDAGSIYLCPQLVRSGGTICWVGLGPDPAIKIDYQAMVYKEATVKTVCRYRHVYPRVLLGLSAGLITTDGIISDEYPCQEIQAAYERANSHKDEVIKTIIRF